MTTAVTTEERRTVTKFTTKVSDYLPYLLHYVYGMNIVESSQVKTMEVDHKGNMYYSPEFVRKISRLEGMWCVCHETLHLVLRHHVRAIPMLADGDQASLETRRLALNIAWDLAIEQMLASIRQYRPKDAVALNEEYPNILGGIHTHFPEGKTGEEYYGLIMKQINSKPNSSNNDAGDEADDSDSDDDSNDDGSTGAGDPRNAGSSSDGQPRDYELNDEDGNSWASYKEHGAAQRTAQFIESLSSSGKGDIPAEVRKIVKSTITPTVANVWDQLDAHLTNTYASAAGKRERTRRKHCRKQPIDESISRLHGWEYRDTKAVLIIDVSASMSEESTRGKALDVIAKGLYKYDSVTIRTADTEVCRRECITSAANFHLERGGGTNMREAIETVDREDKPDAIILVTDCETGWPRTQPRAEVTVASTSSEERWTKRVPEWATLFSLQEVNDD